MEPLDEFRLDADRGPLSTPPSSGERWRAWAVVAVVVLLLVAAAAYFLVRPSRNQAAGSPASAPGAQTPSQARRPLGPDVPPHDLPPLDLTDPVVRELLRGLSSRPELATWLATDGLIRNFAASVDAVANGDTPSTHLRPLAPKQPFAVHARGTASVIDERAYRRFDGIADTVAELDADGLARAYVTLRPRLQEAYRELGYPDGNIDDAVQRAITRLLETPVIEREVEVQQAPVLYQFSDPRIERLSSAQKQLLRTGPRNQRIIQDKLRAIARALSISNG